MLIALFKRSGSVNARKEKSLMRTRMFSAGVTAIAIVALTVLGATVDAIAQQEKVLYNFLGVADGFAPNAVPIFDAAGNLYGTAGGGGTGIAYGTVFELIPAGAGVWVEKTLHTFTKNDGHSPSAGLVADAAGNLYGTTYYGGVYETGSRGGTVFELTRGSGGAWTEKVLHSFGSGTDGSNPYAGLILDSAGNLYGTTTQGGNGTCNCGTVFELSPNASGNWTERILHTFTNNGTDANYPYTGLTLDAFGNLYGVTSKGGIYNDGTVFEVKPVSGGGWTEKVLHSFNTNFIDGAGPFGSLILDAAGNLYGTTLGGGAFVTCDDGGFGCGTVFELTPTVGGGWKERVLHSFTNNGQDGYYPYASLVLDGSGNLYGTASTGGSANNFAYGGGTVFELKPTAGGTWTQKTLHSFGSGTDAAYPQAGLAFGPSGSLYGTTPDGGPGGWGAVYEIKP
jgi:uncharacterized repeat protein (TIGR03803 family)